MKFDDLIFFEMIENGILPKDGIFSISEQMKEIYIDLYRKYSLSDGNFRTISNKNYALKLAGLSLLKLNDMRRKVEENYKKRAKIQTKSGILYLISNPAFKEFLKIGITKDLKARLQTYQTYDPYKNFKVEHYKIVEDAKKEEKYFLNHHKIHLAKGEWIFKENAKELFLSGR